MKRFYFASALLAAFLFVGSSSEAVHMTIAERFAAEGAVQTGESGVYKFDKAHTFIGFKVKHMGLIDVPGFFRDFTGSINYDAKDAAKSSVEFTAKATSIDTGVVPRDNHLRGPDFFDVDKFPDVIFKSTKVEKKGKDLYITGDLTMKGVKKSISFEFDVTGFVPGNERSAAKMGVTADTKINRRDFGITYGNNLPSGVAAISDNVHIDLQIEANKENPTVEAK